MSLDAIKEIRGAEGTADQTRADAKAKAQKILADAERAGKERISGQQAQAAAEAAEAMRRVEAEAQTRTAAILAQAKAEADALRARAEANMAQAAKAITERVVES